MKSDFLLLFLSFFFMINCSCDIYVSKENLSLIFDINTKRNGTLHSPFPSLVIGILSLTKCESILEEANIFLLGRFFTISSYELNQLYEKVSNYIDLIPSEKIKPLLFFQNLSRNLKQISVVCLECGNKETDFAFISIKDKNISFIIQNNFFFESITFSGKDLNLNFVESVHLSCYFEKEECCSLIECNYSNDITYENNSFLFKIMSGSLNFINTNFYNIEVYGNSGYKYVFYFESVLNGTILTIRNSILKNLYFAEGLIKLCSKNVNLSFKNVIFLNYNTKGILIDTAMLNIDNSSFLNFDEIKITNCKAKVFLFLNNSYFTASSIQLFDLNFSKATVFRIEN